LNIADKIQEIRKQNFMSQEQMAEKLGVSRQAISKWESGASVPEIDKLIMISKMFGISLNELLGVDIDDEQDGEQGKNGPSDTMTDDMVENVCRTLKNYIDSNEKERYEKYKKRRNILIAVGIVFAFALMQLFGKINNMDTRITNTYMMFSNDMTSLRSQVGNLSEEVSDILKQQNSLLVDYRAEFTEEDVKNNKMSLYLSATPKNYAEGMTAEFYIEGSDFAPKTVPANNNGDYKFECTADIPFSDINVIEVHLKKDGEQQTQRIDPPYDGCIKDAYKPYVFAVLDGMTSGGALKENPLTGEPEGDEIKQSGTLRLTWEGKTAQMQNGPEEAWVEIKIDGKTAFKMPIDLKNTRNYEADNFEYLVPIEQSTKLNGGKRAELIVVFYDKYGIRYDVIAQAIDVTEDELQIDYSYIMNGNEVKVTYPWEK